LRIKKRISGKEIGFFGINVGIPKEGIEWGWASCQVFVKDMVFF